MSEIGISVIIPVFNVEKFVDGCLESVCSQSFKNIEIIIIDDGSTDNSFKLCCKWAEIDRRVKLIRQTNQGVSVARNRGIKESLGKWIAFIDPDDSIEPSYLEELCKLANMYDSEISICGFYFDYPDEVITKSHFETDIVFRDKSEIMQIQIQILAKRMSKIRPNSGDKIGAPWGKLYSASFIKRNGLEFVPNLKRSQDLIFNLYALEHSKFVAYINRPLYHYRVNSESICNRFSKQVLDNVNAYLNEIDNFIKKFHKDDELFNEAYDTKVATSIYKCMFQYFFNDQYDGKYSDMKKELFQYISQDQFKYSLKKVKYRNLEKTEKIFVFLIKYKMIIALLFLVNIRQRIKKYLRY
jgi:glycosyltransferase involved in cell wall biosynthesis